MNKSIVSMSELMPVIIDKLQSDGEVSIKIKGTSMRPFFQSDKTIVTLSKITNELKPFDIVLYQSKEGFYVIHRFIRLVDNDFVICGDALMKNEKVAKNQLLAVVSSFTEDDKTILVTDSKYLLKVRLWVFFKPIRRLLLRINHHLRRR